MSKRGLLAALLVVSFIPAGFAQTPPKSDKATVQAKKSACQAQAKAQHITDRMKRKSFMADCLKG